MLRTSPTAPSTAEPTPDLAVAGPSPAPAEGSRPSRSTASDGPAVRRAASGDLAAAERVMRGVLTGDLGGYDARWHRDLDDLAGVYGAPGHALFVAEVDGEVAGTAAVRPSRLLSPPNPAWIAEEFGRPDVCQLVRVWVAPTVRRCGAGRALVAEAVRWAVGDGGYRRVYLHTDVSVPGAEAFWRAHPVRELHDARHEEFSCVHFELDAAALAGRC